MDIHTDTVSKAVDKVFAITSFSNHIASYFINFKCRYTRFYEVHSSHLCFKYDFVDIGIKIRRFTD